MIIIKGLEAFGDYCTLMWRSISVPEKWKEFFRRYLNEISKLGIDSIPLILIVSLFIGCLCTILIKLNMESPLLPRYTVGFSTREIILLEFSSSILCLILSGKIGSNIASEIGTMRVTEQIDALDIMGVNSANYLIMPKVLGLVTIMPFLVISPWPQRCLAAGRCALPAFSTPIPSSMAFRPISCSSMFGLPSSSRWCSAS